MTGPRFIALFPGEDGLATSEREVIGSTLSAQGFETLHADTGVHLLGSNLRKPLLVGKQGLVLGQLYRRDEPTRPVASFSETETSTISGSGGASLVRDYWGSYCALIRCKDGWRVLRDPSAGFGCYRIAIGKVRAVVSDPALARDLRLITGHIDWPRVVHGLLFRDLLVERTRIHGCYELFPGCLTKLDGTATATWRPGDFTQTPGLGKADLHQILNGCTSALVARHDHILLELSGGLDSSLLACALDDAGARFSCVTLVTQAGDGDERQYARKAAITLGRQLHEVQHRPDLVDFGLCPAPQLPGPTIRAFAQSSDALLAQTADAIGADAFVSGGGGDNIFCNMNSATVATDRLLATRSPIGFSHSLRDLAKAHGVSAWTALRPAWRHAKAWRGDRPWPRDETLLSHEAIARFPSPEHHPWISEPGAILPGKRRHVESILAILNHVIGFPRGGERPLYFPFLTQPMIEACLATPSWRFFEGGVDRAPERRLLARRLPLIAARRSKGGVGAMTGALFRQHRPHVRSLVLEGELARQRLIDRTYAEALLRDDAPIIGEHFYRLLAFAEIEAWAKHWR